MSTENKNIETVREMFHVMEKDNFSGVENIIAENYLNHESVDDGRSDLRGPDEFKETTAWLRAAFGDIRFEEQELLASDDKVFVRVFMLGEHVGEFFGNKATGAKIKHHQWHLFHLVNGKIVEHGAMRDDIGLMKQIKSAAATAETR